MFAEAKQVRKSGRAMDQVVSRRYLTAYPTPVLKQWWAEWHFTPSTSGFSTQYNSTNAPWNI